MLETRGATVAVIDGGGRGAALVEAYAKSRHVAKIIAIPGNDMMQKITQKPVSIYPKIATTNVLAIVSLCDHQKVTLVDIAEDYAIEAGVVDGLIEIGIAAVGPTRIAGQIEWDKIWSSEFMQRHNISHPEFRAFQLSEEGIVYIRNQPETRRFVKLAGLARGKGAKPAINNEETIERIKEMDGPYIIEDWVDGEEFSLFAISDGINVKVIKIAAVDYKRAEDFDKGENTGSMGCTAPTNLLTDGVLQQSEVIFEKAIDGLREEARPYKGVIYLGGMVADKGVSVIEFNARWGDPEAQVVVPAIENDLFEIGMGIAEGNIRNLQINTDGKTRVAVTGAARGYPGDYSGVVGKQVFGLDRIKTIEGVRLYGAGIKVVDGKHYAAGGRLFYIVGEGNSVTEARKKAYEAMEEIQVEGDNLHYRTDIGSRDITRLNI